MLVISEDYILLRLFDLVSSSKFPIKDTRTSPPQIGKSSAMLLLNFFLLALPFLASAAPRPKSKPVQLDIRQASSYWLSQIPRNGQVAYGSNPAYKVFRNVKDYGAVGDGSTDDTVAINNAITDGSRCGQGCDSSTTTPAIIYFPPGTYAVSAPIIQLYYTQFVGDAVTIPTILALPSFEGLAVLDTDPYIPGGNGAQWYTNQNNFYRQMRNLVVDISKMPEDKGAGIHWQVAQATSLQNIVFNMRPKSPTNKQQGIFMDNGSGGFMRDLIFNGGNYGVFLGNQQFTSSNLTFNGCNTAIFMNWNWLWTFKSVSINNCGIGLDMSNLQNGVNQTVGSVIVLDTVMKNTPIGIKTSYNQTSAPATAGTLALQTLILLVYKLLSLVLMVALPFSPADSSWLLGVKVTCTLPPVSPLSQPNDKFPDNLLRRSPSLPRPPSPSPSQQSLHKVHSL